MPLSVNMIHFGPLCSWISIIKAVFLDSMNIIHNQMRMEGCNCKRKCNWFILMDIVSLTGKYGMYWLKTAVQSPLYGTPTHMFL